MARKLTLNDVGGNFIFLLFGLIISIIFVSLDRLLFWCMIRCRRRDAPRLEFAKRYAATITKLVSDGVFARIEFQPRDYFLSHQSLNPHNDPPLTAEQLGMDVGQQLSVQYYGKDFLGRQTFRVIGWKRADENHSIEDVVDDEFEEEEDDPSVYD